MSDIKKRLREKYSLPVNAFVIGSFQRDTEGHDLISPKLEKGPDLLADAIITIHEARTKSRFNTLARVPPIHVVLAGWRRQYIMSRLDAASVPYTYFDRPPQDVLNELYQTLDLYPVTARQEGGPQSLIECGLLNIPVISRPVGIADMVLPNTAINDQVTLAFPSVPDVEHLRLPKGYEPYRCLIEEV